MNSKLQKNQTKYKSRKQINFVGGCGNGYWKSGYFEGRIKAGT